MKVCVPIFFRLMPISLIISFISTLFLLEVTWKKDHVIFVIDTVAKNVPTFWIENSVNPMIDYISFSYVQDVSDFSHFLSSLSFSVKLKPKI